MSTLPRLKVSGLGWEGLAGIYDFEIAASFPFGKNILVIVEGNAIASYQDLLTLVERPEYRDKDALEVQFLEFIIGG